MDQQVLTRLLGPLVVHLAPAYPIWCYVKQGEREMVAKRVGEREAKARCGLVEATACRRFTSNLTSKRFGL